MKRIKPQALGKQNLGLKDSCRVMGQSHLALSRSPSWLGTEPSLYKPWDTAHHGTKAMPTQKKITCKWGNGQLRQNQVWKIPTKQNKNLHNWEKLSITSLQCSKEELPVNKTFMHKKVSEQVRNGGSCLEHQYLES